MAEALSRSGFAAIVGPPNVGKSSLINALLGQEFLAVTSTAQTTIQNAPMLLNVEESSDEYPLMGQIVLVDTPGIAALAGEYYRSIVADALMAASQADVVLRLIDDQESHRGKKFRKFWQDVDAFLGRKPIIYVGTKADLEMEYPRDVHLTMSATQPDYADQYQDLVQLILQHLPEGPPLYDTEILSTRNTRAFVVDWVREALLEALHDELPHATAVLIDRFQERDDGSVRVDVTLAVERDSQKQIIVGRKGQQIKALGQKARETVTERLGIKVHLFLHVAVKPKWRNDAVQWRQMAPEYRKQTVDRICAQVGI